MKAGIEAQVKEALSRLEQMSTTRDRENLARFGITAHKAFGVSVANIQALAKHLGRSHELAAALKTLQRGRAAVSSSFRLSSSH